MMDKWRKQKNREQCANGMVRSNLFSLFLRRCSPGAQNALVCVAAGAPTGSFF